MFLKTWRCITIVLTALALTMESAHVLELPQKMQYDAQMYAAVNTTLYRYFAIVGGGIPDRLYCDGGHTHVPGPQAPAVLRVDVN